LKTPHQRELAGEVTDDRTVDMAKRICSIDDCDRSVKTRGWCNVHYMRWWYHGDPLWTRPSTAERFWANVDKNGPIHPVLGTRCWLWTGTTAKGYGRFSLDGKQVQAHRLSCQWGMGLFWEHFGGDEVDHRCFNRACVNPKHLRPATRKQNGEHKAGAQRNSRSGVRGVHWSKVANRWTAQVKHNGRTIHVGLFDSVTQAEAAVIAKRCEVFSRNDLDRLNTAAR
jgi:hypothetical protein